ncbi:methyltransferase [Cesiribacter sp. SM1]|uniref:methyltransferase n=1 Tax=Cesiribacter sp. SM1 TaxID=2861196 RepID=UPI001CD1CA9E|nr:methyltransferase [Cesiribacter sp. SM1]
MNFQSDNKHAVEARHEAQKIAFGPVAFQAALCLRDLGILAFIEKGGKVGHTEDEVASALGLSVYGVRVLMEAALGLGLLCLNDGRYTATKTAFFILHDRMTIANMDFMQDVCYLGLFHLKESVTKGKPEGLKVFGDQWKTVYEALAYLPEKVQKSWFAFDHYYSDIAFPEALPLLFKHKPATLFDVGGNTGKFSIRCAQYDPEVKLCILDLPGQWNMAANNIKEAGFADRISGYPINLLDETHEFPAGADAVWMSQFLDCFSETEIVSILSRAKKALSREGAVYILETYWDRQRFEAAAFSLQQISLYFTNIANGNSQMYHSKNMIRCIHEAGLYIDEDIDGIGISHTLFRCKAK